MWARLMHISKSQSHTLLLLSKLKWVAFESKCRYCCIFFFPPLKNESEQMLDTLNYYMMNKYYTKVDGYYEVETTSFPAKINKKVLPPVNLCTVLPWGSCVPFARRDKNVSLNFFFAWRDHETLFADYRAFHGITGRQDTLVMREKYRLYPYINTT